MYRGTILLRIEMHYLLINMSIESFILLQYISNFFSTAISVIYSVAIFSVTLLCCHSLSVTKNLPLRWKYSIQNVSLKYLRIYNPRHEMVPNIFLSAAFGTIFIFIEQDFLSSDADPANEYYLKRLVAFIRKICIR